MAMKLRDVTREFSLGDVSLEMLRTAAHAEIAERDLADKLLKLIGEWERSAWPNSAWSRNELRDRAKQLVPPAPEPTRRRLTGAEAAASMYETGVRGRRRPS
jgi:hypothetical protein